MPTLYPSWIEMPAADFHHGLEFYRAVLQLVETPIREAYTTLVPSDGGMYPL